MTVIIIIVVVVIVMVIIILHFPSKTTSHFSRYCLITFIKFPSLQYLEISKAFKNPEMAYKPSSLIAQQ